MKFNYLFILGFLLVLACKENKSVSTTPVDPVQGTADLKEFTLTEIAGSNFKRAVKKDENGHTLEEGYVLDGVKTGAWYNYYPDGRVLAVRNFVNGKVDGTYLTIDDRGRVVLQAFYKDNYLDGLVSVYKIGSRKMKETYYKNGKKEGIEREYFELGPPQKESNYKADVLDGKMRFYNEKAELVAEYEYKNGVKVSGGAVNGAQAPAAAQDPTAK
ncbi:MAG: toxin-antitoxin system YwqK family antitoxin [Saprospiraceae bacterium]|jgi:antitoxin component YwqK of YwqJK toxin-antitoxin module|nr:toxin-antitoxin system YwqK family antitoxin [Saprospiraceae bacterium]